LYQLQFIDMPDAQATAVAEDGSELAATMTTGSQK
jgi:hypothetical protein